MLLLHRQCIFVTGLGDTRSDRGTGPVGLESVKAQSSISPEEAFEVRMSLRERLSLRGLGLRP